MNIETLMGMSAGSLETNGSRGSFPAQPEGHHGWASGKELCTSDF